MRLTPTLNPSGMVWCSWGFKSLQGWGSTSFLRNLLQGCITWQVSDDAIKKKKGKKRTIHHIVPEHFDLGIFYKSKDKPYKPTEDWQGAKNRNADELTAHGHGGRLAQHGAHAAARHALIAPTGCWAQGHDCQRSCLHLHLSQPALQRLPIKQPGDASCGGLGRAAELDGLTRLLDSRWRLRNKTGSYI